MQRRNRYSTWFAGRFADWDLEDPDPPYVDLHYFADVMRAFDDIAPRGGWHVVMTDELVGPAPVTGDDVVVVCLGDELAVTPRYAHDVRLVAKTMGANRRMPYVGRRPSTSSATVPLVAAQEVIVQGRRARWAAHAAMRSLRAGRRAELLDIPLGIRAYVSVPFVPIDERRYDTAFAGSLVNEEREQQRPWLSQKLRARQALLAELEALRDRRPDLSIWLRMLPSYWVGATATGSYAHAMAEARTVLCPRGSALETYRYFEALRAGAIPIYEMLPRRDYYAGAPGIRIRDWSEAERVLDALLSNSDDLHRRHRASLEWYERWVAPDAVARRIAGRLAG